MLNDILPFIHFAAGYDDFKITNHLAHGQTTRNNDDTGNTFLAIDPGRCVIGHRAPIMGDDNTLLLGRPS